MQDAINRLINYWEEQKIKIFPSSVNEIMLFEKKNNIELPYDLIEFYSRVNGMAELYPNYTDEEGYLFYPLKFVVSCEEMFKNEFNVKASMLNTYVLADYLHKSWWYGLKIHSKTDYSIGFIPDHTDFQIITNSLEEFIQLYLIDSPKLYGN